MQNMRMKKYLLAFSMWKQPWQTRSNIVHDTQFFFKNLFCFMNHKLYKFVWFFAIM
jgi:hypothetical protein